MDNPKYELKGLTPGGFALNKIEKSFKSKEAITKEDLIENDTHAVAYTFQTILTGI